MSIKPLRLSWVRTTIQFVRALPRDAGKRRWRRRDRDLGVAQAEAERECCESNGGAEQAAGGHGVTSSDVILNWLYALHERVCMYRRAPDFGESPVSVFLQRKWLVLAVLLPGFVSSAGAQETLAHDGIRLARQLIFEGKTDTAFRILYPIYDSLASSPIREPYFYCGNLIVSGLIRVEKYSKAESLALALQDRISRELGANDSSLADTYTYLGFILGIQNRLDSAEGYCANGIDILRRLRRAGDAHLANLEYTLGTVRARKGKLAEALEAFAKAAEIQQAYTGRERVGYAITLTMTGEAQERNFDPSGAISSFERAAVLFDSLGLEASDWKGLCFYCQAVCYKDLGDFEKALSYARRSSIIFRGFNGGENAKYASSLGQIGDILLASGDAESALEFYREALRVTSRVMGKKSGQTLEIERKTARILASRCEYGAALDIQLEVLNFYRKTIGPNNPELAFLYEEIGDTYRAMGDGTQALASYSRAIHTRNRVQGTEARLDIAAPLTDMGSVYLSLGDLRRALPLLERSLAIQDSSTRTDRTLKSTTLELLARVARRRGRLTYALRLYERGLAVLDGEAGVAPASRRDPEAFAFSPAEDPPVPYTRNFVRLLDERAHTLLDSARVSRNPLVLQQSALNDFTRATAAIRKLRTSYRSTGSKLVLQEDALSLYQSGLDLAASLYAGTADPAYSAAAFSFAEESKAAVLSDGLWNSRGRKSNGSAEGLFEQERRIRAALSSMEERCNWADDHGDSVLAASLRKSLVRKYDDLDRLEDSLSHAGLPLAGEGTPACGPDDIRQALRPGTAFVEYSLSHGRVTAFVLSRDAFDMVSLRPRTSVDSLAAAYRFALKTMDDRAIVAAGDKLRESLIAPIRKQIRRQARLVIVPDGPLLYVPFEPLLSRQIRGPGGVGAHPGATLLGSYEISYALSGSVFLDTRERSGGGKADPGSFAGFAPVFKDSPRRALTATKNDPATVQLIASRSALIEGKKYAELPCSEIEVRNISGIFARNGKRVWCAVDDLASEANFKANAGRYAILHIATHTHIDEDHPGLSAIMFSPEQGESSGEDGILYAGEIADLRLSADLVVLSSCESGIGRMVKGEGLMALTRGFLLAGARNLVYSLWKVDDMSTSFLMQRFYAHVLGGDSYAAALRNAKLEMMQTPGFSNPLKWAGFILMGQ